MNIKEVVKALEKKALDGDTEAVKTLIELKRTSTYEKLIKNLDDDELAFETE